MCALAPVASGLSLLTIATGVDFVVEDLSVCEVSLSLLSGQDGLDVVVVQAQSLGMRLSIIFQYTGNIQVCDISLDVYFDIRQVDEARE